MAHWHWQLVCGLFGLVAPSTGCNRSLPPTSEDTNTELGMVSPSWNAEVNVPAHLRGGQVEVARAGNVRYIGALSTRDGRHLRPQVLLRSGRLAMVNDEGYAEMIRLGIASVIDFRSLARSLKLKLLRMRRGSCVQCDTRPSSYRR